MMTESPNVTNNVVKGSRSIDFCSSVRARCSRRARRAAQRRRRTRPCDVKLGYEEYGV